MHEKYETRRQPLTLAKLIAHYSGSTRASRYEIDEPPSVTNMVNAVLGQCQCWVG